MVTISDREGKIRLRQPRHRARLRLLPRRPPSLRGGLRGAGERPRSEPSASSTASGTRTGRGAGWRGRFRASSTIRRWAGSSHRARRHRAQAGGGGVARLGGGYHTLFESIDEGFCIVEVIFDGTGQPVDYCFLEVNPAFERLHGAARRHGQADAGARAAPRGVLVQDLRAHRPNGRAGAVPERGRVPGRPLLRRLRLPHRLSGGAQGGHPLH